jgi:hypothetical protein
MFANSVGLVFAYLLFGLLTVFLARKGRPADWDETLLASILGPPLFALIATAVAANFVWTRLQATPDGGRRPWAG